MREQHTFNLFTAMASYNWNHTLQDNEVVSSYSCFTQCKTMLNSFIDHLIPVKQITITDSCPPFITPLIKSLLRKRNKLMQNFSSKIGKLIGERRSESLSNVNPRSSLDLWSSLKPAIKKLP